MSFFLIFCYVSYILFQTIFLLRPVWQLKLTFGLVTTMRSLIALFISYARPKGAKIFENQHLVA